MCTQELKIDRRLEGDGGSVMRRAGTGDFEAVLAVVHDATRRVQEKAFAQWRYYLTDKGIRSIRERLDGSDGVEVYVAERRGAWSGRFRCTGSIMNPGKCAGMMDVRDTCTCSPCIAMCGTSVLASA